LQRLDDRILHSASDLVHFLECGHRTTLDLQDLDDPQPKAQDDEHAQLVQRKGIEHERAFLETLRGRHPRVVEIVGDKTAGRAADLDRQAADTLAAMRAGVDIVYQATLCSGNLIGHADFLRRVPRGSSLGAWHYEVLDTKLARRPQAKFLIQLAFYSRLLAPAQGREPEHTWVVTGDALCTEHRFRVADARHYVDRQVQRYLASVGAGAGAAPTYPEPCDACDQCRWRGRCEQQRLDDDHPCQVAGITRQQTRRLQAAGLPTMAALATLPAGASVPKVQVETLVRLHAQASLQHRARLAGTRLHELISPDLEGRLGFHRLPAPDPHDLYFDMEGDPLELDGLEYLFGVSGLDADPARAGEVAFRAFWAHDRDAERRAFEAFIDFLDAHLAAHPGAHVYHYAPYERTALERLMSFHGTREAEVDRLFRGQRLVDLYAVVRGAVRISEPRYSIKNVERFYRGERAAEVTNAGQSVVWYHAWRATQDQSLLDAIERYNRDDVESTGELHAWLLGLRPPQMPWRALVAPDAAKDDPDAGPPSDHALAQQAVREALEATLPVDRAAWSSDHTLRELTALLLDFHRRSKKPEWWAMFDRMTWTDEELAADVECLGGLVRVADVAPVAVARSKVWTFRCPDQESKLEAGAGVTIAATGRPASIEGFDEAAGIIRVKYAVKHGDLPDRIGLGPGGPIKSTSLEIAIRRFAQSLIAGDGRYPAIEALLRRDRPRITGLPDGDPIVAPHREAMPQIIDAIARLDRSVMYVQGPPGAGKTYTGSHVIAELLARGKRVGVMSNSHKAIHNLLAGVEKVAAGRGLRFMGAKKSSRNDPATEFDGPNFENVAVNGDIAAGGYQLVAGTAWLFADPALDRRLDHLFVDEAGQVSLANLVAAGTSAANIVLLGDQMQLAQPTQGVHPGRSGESTLEYLLDGVATIPSDRGIFLARTFRMAPDLCRFVSDAIYEGRLTHDACTAGRRLVLDGNAHPALRPAGLQFHPVAHDACSHRSDEEADEIARIVASLLSQRCIDEHGAERVLTLDDILVVAPYNMQVNLLKARLPAAARVGTVDKFQGQEAEVVLVSMTTSSDEYLPRSKEFLYSRNRLNVAVSRGRCLAVVVGNERLMDARCSTVEELALVNLLCWAGTAKAVVGAVGVGEDRITRTA
jgi:predicted RecB family nuclease